MENNFDSKNSSESPVKGFSLYALSIFMLAITDASAKWLTAAYPIGELVFFRSIFSFVPLFFISMKYNIPLSFATSRLKMNVLRAVVVVLTAVTFFISVKHLPLANATVLSLSNPFFMAILGLLLLKETVSKNQWLAILLGFVGVVVSVGGLASGSLFYSFIGVFSAILYALGGIITRHLSKTDSSFVISLYTTVALLIFSISMIDDQWRFPKLHDLIIFSIMGLSGGLCNYVATSALGNIDVAKVAPLEYTIIIWAAIFGMVIFNETPSVNTVIGSVFIILGGFLQLKRKFF